MSAKTKYRSYKNGLEMWLSSKKGKRVLNFLYSWGAAVVIIGALFKLLHLPFGNQMLFVGMITEFFVFFVSGFEQPEEQYRWEQVFPELDSKNPMDREEMAARRQYLIEKARQAKEREAALEYGAPAHQTVPAGLLYGTAVASAAPAEGENTRLEENGTPAAGAYQGPAYTAGTPASSTQPTPAVGDLLPQEQVERLSESISRLSEASEQLARMGQLSDRMAQQWESLLLDPDGMTQQTESYKQQIEALSRNLTGLNTIYEIQLKGVSSQIDNIEHINSGLARIRGMYDNTVTDSMAFRRENEQLAAQLAELNRVYARLLEALTVNMGAPGMPYRPYNGYQATQQPGYSAAQPAYSAAQQPAYPAAQQPAYSAAQQPGYSAAQPQANAAYPQPEDSSNATQEQTNA